MESRESFILIKPDGLENKEVTQHLIDKLKENEIDIIDQNKTILKCVDVLTLWPAYKKCYISRRLLVNYLADKEIEVWRVTGNQISEKLNIIKKDIRNNYGRGCIANCIHTPLDDEEARWQYILINKKKIEIDLAKENVECYSGLFGKVLNVDKEMLEKVIDDVFIERSKSMNKQMVVNEISRSSNNETIVNLLDQTKVSIDYAVSVLVELFDNYYSLKDIINIILDVDLYGERRLIVTSHERACIVKDMLVNKYELDAELEKIVKT